MFRRLLSASLSVFGSARDARRLLPVVPGLWGITLLWFVVDDLYLVFYRTTAAAVVRGSIRRLRELAEI